MAGRVYTETQVEAGLELLHQQMHEEFLMWARLCRRVVQSYVPADQQAAAMDVIGMPLERIRVDVLGKALKGLPQGLPEDEKKEPESPGYFA